MNKDFWDKIKIVGEAIGLSKANLYKIKKRGGVPPKHHYAMVKKAEKMNIPLSYNELVENKAT